MHLIIEPANLFVKDFFGFPFELYFKVISPTVAPCRPEYI